MLTVVHDTDEANANDGGLGRSLLDEIVRDGARQMLAAALQAEVAAYIDAHASDVDENGCGSPEIVEGFLCRFRLGVGFPDLVVDGR